MFSMGVFVCVAGISRVYFLSQLYVEGGDFMCKLSPSISMLLEKQDTAPESS